MNSKGGCIQSGYCCTVRPCQYGATRFDIYGRDKSNTECVYLEPPSEDTGQRACGLYHVICILERNYSLPMMGSGCSSTLFNTARDRVKKRLKLLDKSV
jgi:hypothetical protein